MRRDLSTIIPATMLLLESLELLGLPKGLWHSESMNRFEDETPLLPRPSRQCSVNTARHRLSSHALRVLAEEADDVEMSKSTNTGCIIWPWNIYHQGGSA